jgi:hypothetical protein
MSNLFKRAEEGPNDIRQIPRRCTSCRKWTKDDYRWCFECRHRCFVDGTQAWSHLRPGVDPETIWTMAVLKNKYQSDERI